VRSRPLARPRTARGRPLLLSLDATDAAATANTARAERRAAARRAPASGGLKSPAERRTSRGTPS